MRSTTGLLDRINVFATVYFSVVNQCFFYIYLEKKKCKKLTSHILLLINEFKVTVGTYGNITATDKAIE